MMNCDDEPLSDDDCDDVDLSLIIDKITKLDFKGSTVVNDKKKLFKNFEKENELQNYNFDKIHCEIDRKNHNLNSPNISTNKLLSFSCKGSPKGKKESLDTYLPDLEDNYTPVKQVSYKLTNSNYSSSNVKDVFDDSLSLSQISFTNLIDIDASSSSSLNRKCSKETINTSQHCIQKNNFDYCISEKKDAEIDNETSFNISPKIKLNFTLLDSPSELNINTPNIHNQKSLSSNVVSTEKKSTKTEFSQKEKQCSHLDNSLQLTNEFNFSTPKLSLAEKLKKKYGDKMVTSLLGK